MTWGRALSDHAEDRVFFSRACVWQPPTLYTISTVSLLLNCGSAVIMAAGRLGGGEGGGGDEHCAQAPQWCFQLHTTAQPRPCDLHQDRHFQFRGSGGGCGCGDGGGGDGAMGDATVAQEATAMGAA